MTIVPGLTAAFGWGIGDFLARFVAREIGAFRGLFYFQFVGLAALTLYLAGSGRFADLGNVSDPIAWVWMALTCALHIFASFALFRAFEVGVLTLVSPIAASYGALTGALSYLSGERLGPVKTIALGAVLLGVLLASASPAEADPAGEPASKRRSGGLAPGVSWALAGSVTFGLLFWLLGYRITPAFGPVAPVWLFRLVTPIVLALLAVPLNRSLGLPRRGLWGLLAVIGAFDTGAFLASSWGLSLGDVTLTTVLTSLFSAVTVLLAGIFLRERVAPRQWAGVAILLVAIPCTQL
ncbi:MAG TPA: DMT family transporter [Thermoanaerobaculia bacterium]|nr:DMT family transporter [Thermoanaerobaculia bacterium]